MSLVEHVSSPPVFNWVRVTRSLVLCVCFVDRLSFCTFSFGHCVVCSSSMYGFWLPFKLFLVINYRSQRPLFVKNWYPLFYVKCDFWTVSTVWYICFAFHYNATIHVLFMLLVFVCVQMCPTYIDYTIKWRVFYKRQELPTIREHLRSHRFLVGSVLLIFLVFCGVYLLCLSSFNVLCDQCCQFLWIVHSWLPLRFCLDCSFLIASSVL